MGSNFFSIFDPLLSCAERLSFSSQFPTRVRPDSASKHLVHRSASSSNAVTSEIEVRGGLAPCWLLAIRIPVGAISHFEGISESRRK